MTFYIFFSVVLKILTNENANRPVLRKLLAVLCRFKLEMQPVNPQHFMVSSYEQGIAANFSLPFIILHVSSVHTITFEEDV